MKVKGLSLSAPGLKAIGLCRSVLILKLLLVSESPQIESIFLEEPRTTSWRYHVECFPARLRLWNYKQWGLPRALQDWLNALPDSGKADISITNWCFCLIVTGDRCLSYRFIGLSKDHMHFRLQKSYWLWHRRSQRTQGGGCWHAGQWCKVSSDLLDWRSWDSTETRRRRPFAAMIDLKKCCGALLFFCPFWNNKPFLCLLFIATIPFTFLACHARRTTSSASWSRLAKLGAIFWEDSATITGIGIRTWSVARAPWRAISSALVASVWKGSLFQCVHLGTFLPQMCSPLW